MIEPPRLFPDLNDTVPLLREVCKIIQHRYSEIGPKDYDLVLFEVLRSQERQKWCFEQKTSKKDGATSFSRHQYSTAIDLVPRRISTGELTWGNTKSDIQRLFSPIGVILSEIHNPNLEWGGTWEWDWPHVQISFTLFVKYWQALLSISTGQNLAIDGIYGTNTKKAAIVTASALHIPNGESLPPKLWQTLYKDLDGDSVILALF